ncbi:radical SAM family heme chaperone HemW [Olivibacter sp. SDN3]|uniref:radical SAM family heme chaperone HemW n=1 Tax=Olivibacter sp. SDN3 TaxID=2764720 RepID=UPI001651058C|nr:radical SAM family heme chaperone HemW [Olivibacter sp. SDN3]QNL50794.1 radical SAM family heme chaperone HemW [Olivibacter sp. SDN3]
MAGVYFHIPFCKQACHYCDFHFSTALKYKSDLLKAMLREISLQSTYLGRQKIETLYFGGGTPSLLSENEINLLIDTVAKYYTIDVHAEITVEANPDDLSTKKLASLRNTPVNRLSIGIQSFFDEDLKWMNRAHNAFEAKRAIKKTQDAGFDNITADLIYGYPLLDDTKWLANIHCLVEQGIPHISAYSMTVEPRTALDHFVKVGKQRPMDEDQSAQQFMQLIKTLEFAGYEHYEISNFSFPNQYSQHNTNYWQSIPYLGIGPSAHSFNGSTRQWNINNNARYMASLSTNEVPAEIEVLTTVNRINEYLMTSLRTIWGVDLLFLESTFGKEYVEKIIYTAQPFERRGQLIKRENHLTLTVTGKLIADLIASELFIDH